MADLSPDEAVSSFAQLNSSRRRGTGIPKPPTIQSDETSFEPERFNIELIVGADSKAFRGGGGVPSAPTGACCIGTACSIMTEAACVAAGGTYQGDGTPCSPNPCVSCPDINTIELSVAISGKMCSDSEPAGDYTTSKTFHRVTGSTGDDEFSLEDCNLIGPNDNGGFGHPPGRFEWNDGTLHPLFALIVNDGYSLNELEVMGYCSRTISTGMVWTGIGTFSFPISGVNGDGTPWSGTVTLVAS